MRNSQTADSTVFWITTYEGDRLFLATVEVVVTELPHNTYEWSVWTRPGNQRIATGTAFTRDAARAEGIKQANEWGGDDNE